MLNEFGVDNHLGYLVMDNARTNDTLTRNIAAVLHAGGVLYDAEQNRLRRNGHIINLAVQAFLFGETVDYLEFPENVTVSPSDTHLNTSRKLGPLGKLHNIIIWIAGSPQCIQSYKHRSGGLLGRRDNST